MISAYERRKKPWLKFLCLALNLYLVLVVSALLLHLASYWDDALPRTINESIVGQGTFEKILAYIASFTIFSSWSPVTYGMAIAGLIAKELLPLKLSTRIAINTALLLIALGLVKSLYWTLEKGIL